MAQVHQAVEAHLDRPISPAWREGFHRDQEDRMRQELQAIPGVKALVARVQSAGLSACVASQGRHEKMAISLGATDLFDTFKGRIFLPSTSPTPSPPQIFSSTQHAKWASHRTAVL